MVDECEFDIMDCDHESRINDLELYCPQCGDDVDVLVEGYCQECTYDNYNEQAAFEAQRKRWKGLTYEKRKRQIDQQCINGS